MVFALALTLTTLSSIITDPLISSLLYATLGLLATASVVRGIVANAAAPRGPWLAIAAALLLFMVTAYLRTEDQTLGDLTASRSLVPDAVGFPAYLILGAGLALLVRHRRKLIGGLVDLSLDAAVAALAAMSLAWVFMASPAMAGAHAPLTVKALFILYPTVSVLMVTFTAQLAFTGGGTGDRSSLRTAMGAMTALLIGDIVYTLADARVWDAPTWIVNLPYGIAFSLIALLGWQPAFALITEPVPRSSATARTLRLPVVSVALAIPALVAAFRKDTFEDKVGLAIIVLLLAVVGTLRTSRALRAEEATQQVLAFRATHDQLTGLPNRSAAADHIEMRLRQRLTADASIAVLFLDLDRFKLVNDTYGHLLGDQLLISLGERISALDEPSTFSARIGGDEFVMVLDRVDGADEAVLLAETVRGRLSEPLRIGDIELPVSVSIGVAFADASDRHLSADELLRDADTAMYRAKDSGRDSVVMFDSAMRDRVARRLRVETDLRHAIERDELAVHYQPIVRLPSGAIVGFEALIRWHHPQLGTISPLDFIPVAEETGLIVEIGDWVLDTALGQLATLRRNLADGDRLTMAINVSTRQLLDPIVPRRIAALLAHHGVPGERVFLEVTESMLMDDPAAKLELLNAVKATGVMLSIDDFGTGYSSLSYLEKFPFDRVKIDRAFITGLNRSGGTGRPLVAAILAMADALGLDTIAEGVETPNECDALESLNCGYAQGFLFSRPVPPDQSPQAVMRWGIAQDNGGGAPELAQFTQ